MDALLARVLDAQGGLDHWKQLSRVRARITYDGPFWQFKGHPELVGGHLVEADLQREQIRHVQESTGRTAVFDKQDDRVIVAAADGAVLDQLDHPRATFAGYTQDTTWSLAQIAYFRGYATWHYLVEPYIFAWDGVEAREIEPWTEDGQTWRGLSVTYPGTIDVHNRTQLYYFDDAANLRRMDYQPDVNGGSPVAHYIRAEQTFDGIVVPTRRHIHIRNPDRTPDLSWTPITLDLSEASFRRL